MSDKDNERAIKRERKELKLLKSIKKGLEKHLSDINIRISDSVSILAFYKELDEEMEAIKE